MNYSRSVTFPFGLTGSVNYRENASIADHAIRISGGRKDNSQPLLFQMYQVFQVFQLFQVFQVCSVFWVDSAQLRAIILELCSLC